MREMFSGVFADVMSPAAVLFSPPVLIVAVLILTAGFLGYFIGKAHREKKDRDEKKENEK